MIDDAILVVVKKERTIPVSELLYPTDNLSKIRAKLQMNESGIMTQDDFFLYKGGKIAKEQEVMIKLKTFLNGEDVITIGQASLVDSIV